MSLFSFLNNNWPFLLLFFNIVPERLKGLVIVVAFKEVLDSFSSEEKACLLHLFRLLIFPPIISHFYVKVISAFGNEWGNDFSAIKFVPRKTIKPRVRFHFHRAIEAKA